MPSGFNVGDRASVYTRAPCQLDLHPSQSFACRLYVRAFHSFHDLRGTPRSKAYLMAGGLAALRDGTHLLTYGMSTERRWLVTSEGSKKGNELPKRRQADQQVDDTGKDGSCAEQRRYQVEVEQADEAPVEATDNKQNQSYEVQGLHMLSP